MIFQIYEGICTSYSLSTSESVQLRVQCVRIRNGVESVSLPSPAQLAAPSTVTPSIVRTNEETFASDTEELTTHNMSSMQWIQYYLFSDTHYALAILASLFSSLSFRGFSLEKSDLVCLLVLLICSLYSVLLTNFFPISLKILNVIF